MGIVAPIIKEITSPWAEEAFQLAVKSGQAKQCDAHGLSMLAAASFEAHTAPTSEVRNHWLKIASDLVKSEADILTPLPKIFTTSPEKHTVNDWVYTSSIQGRSHALGLEYDMPFLYAGHNKQLTEFAKQCSLVISLLEHGDEGLSKQVLSRLDDKQYSQLLSTVMTSSNPSKYFEPPPINRSSSGVSPELVLGSFKEGIYGKETLYGGGDHRASAAC